MELEQFLLDGGRTIGEVIDVPALEAIGKDQRDEITRRFFEHFVENLVM